MHFVYTIEDPRLDQDHRKRVVYVGEAKDLMQRLSDHASANCNANSALHSFFKRVFKATGRLPLIVERSRHGTKNEAVGQEKDLISYYEGINPDLFNRDPSQKGQELDSKEKVLEYVKCHIHSYAQYSDLCLAVNAQFDLALTPKMFRAWIRQWRGKGLIL